MAVTNSAVDNGTDRRIESGRLTKALTEEMEIDDHAPGMYEVTNGDDVTRVVDTETGTCECADAQYRGDEYVCKHAIAACIHHAFRSAGNSRLVARVLRRVGAHGCPDGVRGCAGPTTLGARGYPCEGCVASSRAGHWTVWKALHSEASQ